MESTSGTQKAAINACHACQPLGAVYLVSSIAGGVPLVHAPQSCCGYMRHILLRHFRESSRAGKVPPKRDPEFFDSELNLLEAIFNLSRNSNPRLIGVVGTCFSDFLDDINGLISESRERLPEGVEVVPIDAAAPAGSCAKGYDAACEAVLKHLVKPAGTPNGKLNVIPGMLNTGDIQELERILNHLGISFNITYNPVGSLHNASEGAPFDLFAGGTSLEHLADIANSSGIIALCRHAGGAGADYLHRTFNVPALYGPLPVGASATDLFLENVRKLSGGKIPPTLEHERRVLHDAIADSKPYTEGKKVAITGDPDLVSSLTRFTCEMGMEPAVIMGNMPSPDFIKEVQAIAEEYRKTPAIISGSDLSIFSGAISQFNVEMIFGPSYISRIARDTGLPLIRMGFPVYDRPSRHQWPVLGYRGALRILDSLVQSGPAFNQETVVKL
ncbi:MAG: nitrogenase component 1 [Bacillota bacterium]